MPTDDDDDEIIIIRRPQGQSTIVVQDLSGLTTEETVELRDLALRIELGPQLGWYERWRYRRLLEKATFG